MRDQLTAGEEPKAQGVHACKPGFSLVTPAYPWILEVLSSLLASLPPPILKVAFVGEHWMTLTRKPGILRLDIFSLVF